MRDWFTPIDIYCERLDASWWAEPANATTNLAFVLAGLLVMRRAQPPAILLGALIVAIGVGSFLFHTHANRLTGVIDVTLIGAYLVTYAWLWPKVIWNKSAAAQTFSVVMLISLILLLTWANQSIRLVWPEVPPGVYIGAWLFVLGLAMTRLTKHRQARQWLWVTAVLFLTSLIARQLDMPLCAFTNGTHWLWHVLNAGVLYASARAMLTDTTQARTGVTD